MENNCEWMDGWDERGKRLRENCRDAVEQKLRVDAARLNLAAGFRSTVSLLESRTFELQTPPHSGSTSTALHEERNSLFFLCFVRLLTEWKTSNRIIVLAYIMRSGPTKGTAHAFFHFAVKISRRASEMGEKKALRARTIVSRSGH